ncbi:MAG: AI-2E family transporter [Thermosynechococcaceae cyanobacterium]
MSCSRGICDRNLMSEPNPNSRWDALSNSDLLRFLLLAACGWVTVQFIQFFYGVIAMFATAAIIAVLLNYPVNQLTRFVPRGVAIATTVLSTLAIVSGFITILGLEILNQGAGLVNTITATLKTSDLPFENLLEKLNFENLIDVLTSSLGTGLGIAGGLFSNTFNFIFVLVIAVYMLADGSNIWRTCLKIVPVKIRDRIDRTVQSSFIGFFQAQIFLMLFLASLSFVVYTILGVKFALVLSIVVGVLDAIPGIGATLGVLIVTVLVFASQGVTLAIKVIIASLILQQIQDNLVHPRVMKNSLNINPILMFLALFIGEKIAGILGLFLSIPLTGMVVRWFEESEDDEQQTLPAQDEI